MFTNPTDVLPALSGVADVFGKASGDTYVAGLWKGGLPNSLNWDCRNPMELHGFEEERLDAGGLKRYPKTLDKAERDRKRAHREAGYLAPSWSWASVMDSRAHYRHPGVLSMSRGACRILWEVSILDVWVERSSADPNGSLSRGHLALSGRFAEIPNLMQDMEANCNLPHLCRYIQKSIGIRISGFGSECTLKHEPFAGQLFGLLQTGAYEFYDGRYALLKSVKASERRIKARNRQSLIHMLLVESCEDTGLDLASAERIPRSVGHMRWRRLAHFQVSMPTLEQFYDERQFGIGVRKDLESPEWIDKTICLV